MLLRAALLLTLALPAAADLTTPVTATFVGVELQEAITTVATRAQCRVQFGPLPRRNITCAHQNLPALEFIQRLVDSSRLDCYLVTEPGSNLILLGPKVKTPTTSKVAGVRQEAAD